MATQRDVARLAEVSSATVSRFLATPGSVSPAAADKVRAAIAALDYKVDYSAQCLKTGRYNHVGILTPSIGPFYWEAFTWIQHRLNEDGYFCTFFFTRDVDTLDHSFRDQVPPFLQKRQLDGIIYFPLLTREDDQLLERLSEWGRPFVAVDRPLADPRVHQIYLDNFEGGRRAADALLRAGHREFLFVAGTPDSPAAAERFQGFRARLEEAGVELGPDRVVNGQFTASAAHANTTAGFGRLPRFSAVFACNDSSAMGFMRAATERGLACPRDYSIIGYDNNLEFAPFTTPSLSSFSQPVRELADAAARLLLRLMNGEAPAERRVVFRPALLERESLGAAPAD
jgi:DNA-binding LacI/PurR family transcriptional regulator